MVDLTVRIAIASATACGRSSCRRDKASASQTRDTVPGMVEHLHAEREVQN